MRNFKFIILGTAALINFTASNAIAAEQRLVRYNYPDKTADSKLAIQNYMNYEQREPCQNYREPPEGFYYDNCNLYRLQTNISQNQPVTEVAKIEPAAGNIMSTYKVNFGYDQATISHLDRDMLDHVAYKIKNENPNKVIISGYTDTAGPQSYNKRLSRRRADNLTQALNERGVSTQIIQRKAYGENNLAVITPDETPLLENRRATVEFMK